MKITREWQDYEKTPTVHSRKNVLHPNCHARIQGVVTQREGKTFKCLNLDQTVLWSDTHGRVSPPLQGNEKD